jgi:hypothetical protein
LVTVGCAVALEQRSSQGTVEHEAAQPNVAGRPPGKIAVQARPLKPVIEARHPRILRAGPKIIPVPGEQSVAAAIGIDGPRPSSFRIAALASSS